MAVVITKHLLWHMIHNPCSLPAFSEPKPRGIFSGLIYGYEVYAKTSGAAQSKWNWIGIGNFNNFWITVPPQFFVGLWLGVKGAMLFTLKKTISTRTHAHTRNVVVPHNQLLVRTFWLKNRPGVMLSGFFFQYFQFFQNDLLFARDEIQEWLGLHLKKGVNRAEFAQKVGFVRLSQGASECWSRFVR